MIVSPCGSRVEAEVCESADGSAVDADHLPSEVVRVRAGQKPGHFGDIFRRSPTFERRLPADSFLPNGARRFAPGGADPSWCDAVDANLGRQADGQGTR